MAQNMQKKPKQVVSLDVDASAQDDAVEQSESTGELTDDAIYKLALQCLEQGMNQRKIVDELVEQGLSRPKATEVAQKIWKENLSTRQQNVIILVGAGAFFGVLGLAFLLPRLLNSGTLPGFSPAYLFVLFGIYLAYHGYLDWREIR